MDALGQTMTSADVTRWFGYFRACHDLEAEALNITRPPTSRDTAMPRRRGGFYELDEAGLRGFFRSHNARHRAA